MTSLKDQKKLLKDVGKGVEAELKGMSDVIKKIAEPFIQEAIGLPKVKKIIKGDK